MSELSPARALVIAQQIESGICHVSGPTAQDEASIPFWQG